MPAAGLPWFVALFGRDSLIVSLQNALVYPDFARGALDVLAEWQATERDDYRDAEPGKILHELRRGELAHFKLIPHTPYYGTADATPLYLVTLHTAWRCTGDLAMVQRLMPVAERCLRWIDEWGDRDGDGFQEYQTRSPKGYENMAWKDSGDSVMHADGSAVHGPKALCELQGYVFDAWTRMAEIYDALGKPDRAAELRQKAAALYQRFNELFWNEAEGYYAYGLDGDKRPILSVASNPGHLLWSGIVPPDRAGRVVARLMQPDMWSGWGIRTLSAKHPSLQPVLLPERLGLAARQRADRAGLQALRLRGRGQRRGAGRRGGGELLHAEPAAGAVCRHPARREQLPRAVSGRQRAAGLGCRQRVLHGAGDDRVPAGRAEPAVGTRSRPCRSGCRS